jgi:PIN domain nuclease of toxin-antitoxin system
MKDLLLDTCAAIWFAEGIGFRGTAAAEFEKALEGRRRIVVSPITAWEIGILVARNRYRTAIDVVEWLDMLLERGGFALAEMPPRVLAKSSHLPGKLHGDPADRIIVATAREYGHVIMTRDKKILDYAGQGFVQAMLC